MGHKSLDSTTIYVHLTIGKTMTVVSPLDKMGGLNCGEVYIQQIFDFSFNDYAVQFQLSKEQEKTAIFIMACKSGDLGYSVNVCDKCYHTDVRNNSCRNRNCPCCQAVQKERWIDARKAEVIDAPYFHVVFTIPAELRPLVYTNQKLLYSLLHDCSSKTLL